MPQTLEYYSGLTFTPVVSTLAELTMAARFGPSLTIARGTVMGKKTSDGKLYAYNDAQTDGTQTAVALSMYDVKTDSSGNHYLSTSDASPTSINPPLANVPVWIAGVFDTAQMTGWDAAALADFKGRTYGGIATYIIIAA